LVQDVAVDVDQRGAVVATGHLVHFPQLLVQGLAGHCSLFPVAVADLRPAGWKPECRLVIVNSNAYFSSSGFPSGIRKESPMDWASLSAFVAIADRGGFSAAAEQLHLTQPAVSKRIAQLEQVLDVRLFDRLGRQVVLTEAGRLLLPRARQMLAEADAARRALQDLGQEIGGRLSLATSHHVGLHRLPALLRRFTALHPK